MQFYHYTYNTRWDMMQNMGMIQTNNGFGRTMPHPHHNDSDQEMPAIWGLHEPAPKEWHSHHLWNLLINHFCNIPQLEKSGYPSSIVLLECHLPKDSDIWVADWGGFIERSSNRDQNAMQYYAQSMTLYQTFNSNAHDMNAPELISFEDIPIDKIKKIVEIPIDRNLESIRLFIRNTTGLWHGPTSRKKGPQLPRA